MTCPNLERIPVRLPTLRDAEPTHWRPRTRADCAQVPRPCPYVSCSHHLYTSIDPRTGELSLNFPNLEPDELRDSCLLDLADQGRLTSERIGAALGLSRSRTSQIELRALAKLREADNAVLAELLAYLDEDPRE